MTRLTVLLVATLFLLISVAAVPLSAIQEELVDLKRNGYSHIETEFTQTFVKDSERVLYPYDYNVHSPGEFFSHRCALSPSNAACEPQLDLTKGNALKGGKAYHVLPQFMGNVPFDGKFHSFPAGKCFRSIQARLRVEPVSKRSDETVVIADLELGDPIGLTCSELFLFTPPSTFYSQLDFRSGSHTLKFKKLSTSDRNSVESIGMPMFRANYSIVSTVVSLYDTLGLFFGKHADERVRDTLERELDLKLEDRTDPNFVLPQELLETGDVALLNTFDGIDATIAVGTRSLLGHTAIAYRDPATKKLWMLESVDDAPWGKLEPGQVRGIVKTTYEHFLSRQPADRHIVWAKLKPEFREILLAHIDEALEYFTTKQEAHAVYGFRSFFFSFFDSPTNMMPYDMNLELLPVALRFLQHIIPTPIDQLFREGIAWRIGLPISATINQVIERLGVTGLDLMDVLAIPETDDIVYSDGPAVVCSAFATGFLKAGHVFDQFAEPGKSFYLAAVEQTPKDLAQMALYDDTYVWPSSLKCGNLPGACQVAGEFVLPIPGFNSITPYSGMNERCDRFRNPDHC